MNGKDDPAIYGVQGGVNYDNSPEFIGYGNGERCYENPSSGFISTKSNDAGAYIPCGRGGQIFDNQTPYYLLKNQNLQWTKTNIDEMLYIDGVVTTPGKSFAWGRYREGGQYKVGKVHWVSGQAGNEWAGFYVQQADDGERRLTKDFEILSCRPKRDQTPCGTFIKYDPVNGREDPNFKGFLGGFNFDNTKEFIGYGDNNACHEYPCAGFISTDTDYAAGAYMACKHGGSFDNKNAYYLAKNQNLKWKATQMSEVNSIGNILKTPNDRIAWGRIKYEGQYRVGKIHLDWGFYLQMQNNTEKRFENSFEVLTCET